MDWANKADKTDKSKKENPHEGHRKRLRQKYINGGIDALADHEVLEMLLFSFYTRKNTNELAHKILNAYNGSILNVFEATPKDLTARCGISDQLAVHISLIADIANKYLKERGRPPTDLSTPALIEEYVLYIFKRDNPITETFHMICLGGSAKRKVLLEDIVIGEGSNDSIEISMKEIVEKALIAKAVYVVLAHNHPGGTHAPSSTDIKTTTAIKSYLEPIGIKVLDHIIVCDGKAFSFAKHRLCNLRFGTA